MKWNRIIRDSLRKYIEDHDDVSMTTWSTQALGSKSTLKNLLDDEGRDIKLSTIERLADHQGMSLVDLLLYSSPSSLDGLVTRIKAWSHPEIGGDDVKTDALIVDLLRQIVVMLDKQERRVQLLESDMVLLPADIKKPAPASRAVTHSRKPRGSKH